MKKPREASIEEVRIVRDGETAIIEFVDSDVATTHLNLGECVAEMSDVEILDRFNEVMVAQQILASQYEHVAIEIPPGSPQIQYHEQLA